MRVLKYVFFLISIAWSTSVHAGVELANEHGFVTKDGAPLLENQGAYVVQLIHSNTERVSETDPVWKARPLGGLNAALHTLITNVVIRYEDEADKDEYGAFGFIELPLFQALPNDGWLFVRVFGAGSDDPSTAAAFDYYYEGPVLDIASAQTNAFGNLEYSLPPNDRGVPPGPPGWQANILSLSTQDELDERPVVTAWTMSGSGYRVTLSAVTDGNTYILEYSVDLISPAWIEVERVVASASVTVELTDSDHADPIRFYRVRTHFPSP
jgi:hypothetical protein